MAKQDDGNKGPRKTPSTKRNIDYSKAVRVQEAPKAEEGWVEGTDPITGKKMWYRESGTQPGDKPGHPGTPPKPKSTISAPKLKPKPVTPTPGTPGKLPTKTPDTYKQEVVYMDEPVAKPEKVAAQSDVGGRSEYQENSGFYNPNFRLMEYSEAGTGGMSKASKMEVDRTTGRPIDISKSFDDKGNYNPYFTSEQTYDKLVPKSAISLAPGNEVNKDSVNEMLSNTKNPVYRVGTKQELTAPLINKQEQGIGEGLMDVKKLPDTKLLDKTKSPYYNQYQEPEKVTSPKFKNGGYIPKSNLLRKKYAAGGDVTPEEEARGFYSQNGVKYNASGQPVMDSSTFSTQGAGGEALSTNTMPLTSGTEFKTSGDAASTGTTNTTTTGTSNPTKAPKTGGGMGDKMGASMGWFQYANMAQQAGRSSLSKDVTTDPATGEEITKYKSEGDAAAESIMKPHHEQMQEDLKNKEYVAALAHSNAGTGTAYDLIKNKGSFRDPNVDKKLSAIEDRSKTAQNMASRNERSALAQGGTIKGPGTGKSDSILTKIDKKGGLASGSFIVPAENNGLAKKLREKFLGDNPNKVAKFEKGGEAESDVAVSNGEHLFTPKEKQKITAYLGKEILEKLAPEAEDEDEMNCGGKVKLKAPMVKYAKGTPPSGVKRANSTGNPAADKLIDNAYTNPPKDEKGWDELISKVNTLTRGTGAEFNKFKSWAEPKRESLKAKSEESYKANVDLAEKGPDVIKNIKRLKDIGASDDIIKQYTESAKKFDNSPSTVKYSQDDLFEKYKTKVEDEDFKANKESVKKGLDSKVQQAYKELQDANNNADKYTAEEIAKKQEVFDNVASYRDKLNKDIDANDIKAFREAKGILSKESKTKYPDSTKPSATKSAAELENTKQAPADKLGETKPKYELPTNLKERGVPGTTSTIPQKAPKVGAAMTAKKQAQLMSEMGTIEPKAAPSMASQIETQDATLKTPSVNVKEKETITETPTKEGSKWYSGLGSAVEPLAVAGQVGMGLRSLNKAGKLPVDKIDPVFQANVDKAQAAAKFGFTPEQQFSIDKDRQNALNAARFAARNYSGGNAGTAFSQERAAINEGWGRGLKAKIANQELMMDKQRYADTMALQKAGMSRQLFEDKMNAWNQQQQAGSMLLGAGIRNAIGASRYAKELEAQKQRQQYNG